MVEAIRIILVSSGIKNAAVKEGKLADSIQA